MSVQVELPRLFLLYHGLIKLNSLSPTYFQAPAGCDTGTIQNRSGFGRCIIHTGGRLLLAHFYVQLNEYNKVQANFSLA